MYSLRSNYRGQSVEVIMTNVTLTSKNTIGVKKVLNTFHHTRANSARSTYSSRVIPSFNVISPLSSVTETETWCNPCTRMSTRRVNVPARTRTRNGGSDDLSAVTKSRRVERDGREFRRATLVLRSRPADAPGLTRMEGALLNADLSVDDPWSVVLLGGRDDARVGGREEAREGG